jgi:hypothetical protein
MAAYPEFAGRIRFDEATKKGSVLDVIHVMTGQARKHCNRVLTNLQQNHPEVVPGFEKIKIDNQVISKILT